MLKSDQTLEGNNSNQAGRDMHIINNYYDLDIEKAEKIIEEIFQKRLPYFTEIAEQTARERVKPVAEKIIWKILQQKPEAINEFAEPEVQYMLSSAMKTASSTDDDVVCDVLVQLAVDHVLSEERSYERIVDEQAIEMLQKMNREILQSLQELAFWTIKCNFITEKNIKIYIKRGAFRCHHRTYLESIGCVKLNSSDEHLQDPAHRIYQIYGAYLHPPSYHVERISTKLFRRTISKEDFMCIVKAIENEKLSLETFADQDLYSWKMDVGHHLIMLGIIEEQNIFKVVNDIIPKIFYPEKEICTWIEKREDIYKPNGFLLRYGLTPIGFKIQEYLPPLIQIIEHKKANKN